MSSGSSRGEIRVPSLPVRHTDAAYDDYLDSVLYDYGIQFSPGGSGIVEIEEALSPAQVEEEEEETAREIKPLNLKTDARRSDSDGQDAIKFEKKPLADPNHESDDGKSYLDGCYQTPSWDSTFYTASSDYRFPSEYSIYNIICLHVYFQQPL